MLQHRCLNEKIFRKVSVAVQWASDKTAAQGVSDILVLLVWLCFVVVVVFFPEKFCDEGFLMAKYGI